MTAPGWFFNLMILGGALLLFGGIALLLGLFYWLSPTRRDAQNARRLANDPTPQRPNPPQTQRPNAFGSQGIPRSQSANWRDIPESERGASFFSGRPARVGQMHSTTVSLGGRRRRVLVDDDDYAILQTGMMPPFLMFPFGGGYVPWYAYPDYSPYMDFGSGMFGGDYLPYEQVPQQTWGETPPIAEYAYTPDQENYQDYAGSEAVSGMDFGNTVAFEDVYRPSAPDDEQYRDPSYVNAPNEDPLGDPADYSTSAFGNFDTGSGFDNGDPLGDPADSSDAS